MKNQIMLAWLAQFFILSCFGQQFSFHSISPFNIQTIRDDSSGAAQKIMFADSDEDGDLDLFISGLDFIDDVDPFTWDNIHYFMEMQENIGDKWNPQFDERIPVANFPFPLGYFFPSAGDLNDDGNTDFIVSAIVDSIGNRTPTYLSANSGAGNYDVIRFNSIGLDDFVPESFFIPELVDLDVDGDLDILMSGFDPAFGEEDGADIPKYFYAKNIGSSSDPEFLGWYEDPYGLMPNPFVEILSGGDIDNDGDMDLIGCTTLIPSDSLNYLYVHLNSPGLNEKPAFDSSLESPFGLPSSFGEDQFLFPSLVDIDGDGDMDLFVFKGTSDILEFQYYENELCTVTMNEMAVDLCEGDVFMLGGQTFTEAGLYTLHFPAQDGCDSVIQLSITLVPPVELLLEESICEGEAFTIGIETFTVAGNYTVFITAANGCDSIVNLTLVVEPAVNITLNELICEGETFVVGNESFTSSGQYTIVLEAINGCDSIVSLSLIVDQVDNSVTVNQNVLTANLSGGTYQWINCDSGENIPGATSQSYTVLSTGNYGVIITDQFGCSSTSECSFVMITSIEDDKLSNEITIYPNPAENSFFILNKSQNPVSAIMMTNLYGQKIAEYITNGSSPIDISSLAKGVYLVKMKISGHEIIKKLIII